VPMVSALFLSSNETKRPVAERSQSYGNRFVHWVEGKYGSLLSRSLAKGKWVIGIALALLALAIAAFSKLGGEFIPQLDEGDVAFHSILKPGSSLSESIQTTTKIERIIKARFPEVETVISRIGVADVPTDPMPMDVADVFVILKDPEEWTSASSKTELIEKIKDEISIVPG